MFQVEEKEEDVEDFEQLAKKLEEASPLEIMDKALQKFRSNIAIAFSGAEDVALIEYARLTGRPFRVFSLDTGRLNPETYRLFDAVEKQYGIRIEYTFPDAVEVQALVRNKGLFSFYEDGHQECCRVRKVRPLRRALKGLKAWITGQRKDQSPGTRSEIPIVQVDPVFEGLDGGVGSLVKWNPLANVEGGDVWNFLRTMDVPVNALHAQGYVSIGCEPCTRPVLPGQHEREGRWWWEDAKAKECGLHKGNIKKEDDTTADLAPAIVHDIFESNNVVALSRGGIENLLKLGNRKEPWLVVLYAPWCPFCQAMEASYVELAEKLAVKGVKVAKFRADGDQKEFAKQELQLGSFPTILLFPKSAPRAIKYPSEHRDVDSLMSFVNLLRKRIHHIVNSTKTYLGLGNSRDELSAVIRALDILQAVASNTAVFGYSMENRIVPSSFSSYAASARDGRKEQVFTFCYLVDSLGLTATLAESISKKASFRDKGNPDSVLRLLRSYGFTDSQISSIVTNYPRLLLLDAEKCLGPKLQVIKSMEGASSSGQLIETISKVPKLLGMKGDKTITRYYDIVKETMESGKSSKFEKLCHSLPRGMQQNKIRNVSVLRELGVPQRLLSPLLVSDHKLVCGDGKFKETLKKFAMMVKRFPPCLNMSAERVKKRTKFLVKKKNKLMLRKMKWSLNAVASFPQVLGVSMEKRIVPRCNVMKALMLKGLLGDRDSILPDKESVLLCTDEEFLDSLLDAEKYLVPKLNSQQSKGASAPELSEIVLKVPKILRKEGDKTISR
ncbi:hypothetical protein HID58_060259 [Brassica napus]|uniref:Thioredoxin domain-containing protein n=1 Tax=Brassica napus TaxID=3708 RepID=A0ABQ7ZVC0_BRANA|nr:hypothetical protein HID58_060259 [Brassica napus]